MSSSKLSQRVLFIVSASGLMVGWGCSTAPPQGTTNDPHSATAPQNSQATFSKDPHDGSADGPWAKKIQGPPSGGTMANRQCFSREAVNRAAKTKLAVCPSQAEIVQIGLISLPAPPPPGQMAMTGTNLTDGPIEWKGECCYLTESWKTGRPFVVAGALVHAELVSSDSFL